MAMVKLVCEQIESLQWQRIYKPKHVNGQIMINKLSAEGLEERN